MTHHSKGDVLPAGGKPLVLYHGTAESFEAFSKHHVGTRHADIIREDCEDETLDPTAFYFTNDPETAIWYARDSARKLGKPEEDGVVMTVVLAIENPRNVNFHREGREYLGEEIEIAKNNSCDGLICRNYDDGGVSNHYVVFDASKITILKAQTCREFNAGEVNAKQPINGGPVEMQHVTDMSHAGAPRNTERPAG